MARTNSKARQDEGPVEPRPPCQLYLITPPLIENMDGFLKDLDAALAAAPKDQPIACLQIRLKELADTEIIKAAERIVPLCHQYGTLVLINDRPDLVMPCGADGAHIGQSDMDYLSSRELLGTDAIIGVTCHNSRDLAFTAAEDGADYVAFGAFFDTETKAAKYRAEPELLQWWQMMIEVPCVAIGGITPDNGGALAEAGADFLAVSSGVWAHIDGPAEAVRKFYALF